MDDLVQKLRSQIGDDVAAIYDNEQLFRMASDEIEHLRARAEEAEEELRGARQTWRVTLDLLEALGAEGDAQREAAHRSELIGWRKRAEAAEAERDRLHAIVADLVAEHDFGAPANVPVSPETWRRARAALSGGDDGPQGAR